MYEQLTPLPLNEILAMALPIIILFIILGILIIIAVIVYAVRLWMVQRAILQTQKDIAAIKSHIVHTSQGAIVTQQQQAATSHTPSLSQE